MTNFNFKVNWEKLCMPLMRTEQIQKEIKKGVRGYMKNRQISFIYDYKLTDEEKRLENSNKKEYKKIIQEKKNENSFNYKEFIKYDYPLKYAQGDTICDINEEIEQRIIVLLTEHNILKKDTNEPTDCIDEIMEEYLCSDHYAEYQKYKYNVIEPYVNAEYDKDYRYYCLWGGCHWYNPTFGITLARMVMPHIKWKLIVGDFHTTVVSEDEILVFDILYYDENDVDTFGGKHAISDATR